MDQQALEVRMAFERYLETRGLTLAGLTLTSAFKTMLGFHADIQFDWADRQWDNIHLEWSEERGASTQTSGFLGLFKTSLPGSVSGHSVLVSRSLDAKGADEGEDFVILSVKLHYVPTASLESAFAAAQDERLDSSDAESMEDFVAYVLRLDYFKTLALEKPSEVELMLET